MFLPEEFELRQTRIRERMSAAGIDALLISTPENIYYACGLDHMGYFAFQMLILPLQGEPLLVTRAMESATVRDQLPMIRHHGYSDGNKPLPTSDEDGEDVVDLAAEVQASGRVEPVIRAKSATPSFLAPVDATCRALADAGLGRACLALEEGGSFLTYRIADAIKQGMADAQWVDGTGIVDTCRQVLSESELECTRRAGVISDAMLQSGMAAAGTWVNKRDIMAAIYDTMFRRGGTYPGFVPLVRSSASLVHEHGTWDESQLLAEDTLFLEMSGCVRRYHAPMGRLVFIESAPESAYRAHDVCEEALMAAIGKIRDGVMAGDVYEAWQGVLNHHGLETYRRHHCGYSTGIGYPPSWSGGGVPVGLRSDSEMKLRAGMVFHVMSWLLRSEHGDSFLSDTAIVTEDGCELITTTSRAVHVRT